MGAGDYNNDGKSDILWQNSSGAVAIWEMNGTSVLASATIANPGPTWHAWHASKRETLVTARCGW